MCLAGDSACKEHDVIGVVARRCRHWNEVDDSTFARHKIEKGFGVHQRVPASESRTNATVLREDFDAREALTRFYALLDHFSASDRAACVLRNIEGMDLEEVAQALGVSLATVKRDLTVAKAWLHREMRNARS
jgi:RNA polymerase sigma factor (sigma-70 family)